MFLHALSHRAYRPLLPLSRYEAEEDPGVCTAMERTAELFLANAEQPEIIEETPHSAETGDRNGGAAGRHAAQ